MRYRPPTAGDALLSRHDGHLEARAPGDPPGRGVWARWPAPSSRRGGSALLRAIGDAESVIDATAGLGIDAWALALAGRRVTMIERSPVVAALLADAIERAGAVDRRAASRLRLVEGDARALLSALPERDRPPVIYLDPMFPPKRRSSALSSKEMQFLAAVVGEDADAAELLDVARRAAAERVVVKRPPHAPPLGTGRSHAVETKLVRFDVYRRDRSERGVSAMEPRP